VDLNAYQRASAITDQQADDPERRLLVALLGLAGEVGTLVTEHKKWLRDGRAHDRTTGVAEDLGDILWYLAAAANALELDLNAVAEANLTKVKDRWPECVGRRAGPFDVALPPVRQFDDGLPAGERFPRRFKIAFAPIPDERRRAVGIVNGEWLLGDLLGDNAHVEDGYRWHDALHVAHVAVLGWSPVMRNLMRLKRKSRPEVDEVEDGGRAIALEEGIAAAVFNYAADHDWLRDVDTVDTGLLASLRSLTRWLEVRQVSLLEWEQAILRGLACWRGLRDYDGGMVAVDLDRRQIDHRPLTDEERLAHAAVVSALPHAQVGRPGLHSDRRCRG